MSAGGDQRPPLSKGEISQTPYSDGYHSITDPCSDGDERPPYRWGSKTPISDGDDRPPPAGGDERPPLQVGIEDPHTDSTPGELFTRWSFGPSKKSSPGGFLLTPGFWVLDPTYSCFERTNLILADRVCGSARIMRKGGNGSPITRVLTNLFPSIILGITSLRTCNVNLSATVDGQSMAMVLQSSDW